jgi:hypothetical protein
MFCANLVRKHNVSLPDITADGMEAELLVAQQMNPTRPKPPVPVGSSGSSSDHWRENFGYSVDGASLG